MPISYQIPQHYDDVNIGYRVFTQVELDDSLEFHIIGKHQNMYRARNSTDFENKKQLLNQVFKLRKIALIPYEFETPQPVILHLTKVANLKILSPFLNEY